MWILRVPESSLYKLHFQERWLKPGSSTAIGRSPENDVVLDGAKSVSKQHVILRVSAVGEGSSSKLGVHSKFTIEDLQSKFGTRIIGKNSFQITVTEKHEIDTSSISDFLIRLGKVNDFNLQVFWKDIVFTLSNVKPRDVQVACDTLDIKYSREYADSTTHVVTNKYNTPKTLQALAQQRWIVASQYLQAMLDVADDLTRSMTKLPDPSDPRYLPRDTFSDEYGHDAFRPQAARAFAFQNLEFVFFETNQYKSLSSPIQAGHGQAFLYEDLFEMNAIASYLHHKTRPVVVLSAHDEAHTALLDNLTPIIECMTITQADFIRILLSDGKHEVYSAQKPKLLANDSLQDASSPIELEDPVIEEKMDAEDSLQTQPIQLINEDRTSRRIGSRNVKALASFEDDLFGGPIELSPSRKGNKSSLTGTQSRRRLNDAQALENEMDIFGSSLPPVPKYSDTTQRPLSLEPDLGEPAYSITPEISKAAENTQVDEVYQRRIARRKLPIEHTNAFEIAPTAAAFEKLRSEAGEVPSRSIDGTGKLQSVSSEREVDEQPATRKRKRPEITEEDIVEVLKASKSRAEQSELVNDQDIPHNESSKNLGVVEFFKVDLSDAQLSSSSSAHLSSSHWKSDWAGRKNFKQFRKRGVSGNSPSTSRPSIVIRLVESTPSDRGYADKQWLETAGTRNRDRGSSRLLSDKKTSNLDFSPIHVQEEEDNSSLHRRDSPGNTHTANVSESYNRSPRSTRGDQNRNGSISRHQSLFVPDDSDSEEDLLKFRL